MIVHLEGWELLQLGKYKYFVRGRKESGILVNTACIIDLDKDFKMVRTLGGVVYSLGMPSEDFSKALEDEKYVAKLNAVFHE